MQRFLVPIAVAVTSLGLVVAVIIFGGDLVRSAFASGPWTGGRMGPPWFGGGWHTGALPPELAGLAELPSNERFSHFRGARVELTDANNSPLTIDVTPGTVATASATDLTITANDGSTKSFSINDQTAMRGAQAPAQADQVVVVTLNGGTDARAVLVLDDDGFGPWGGHFGRRGP